MRRLLILAVLVAATSARAREKLSIEESVSARAQLVREIQTLPAESLQPRAIAILKAKNRLSADDAKLVEEVFTARMALHETSPEVPEAEGPAPVAFDTAQAEPASASPGPVRRPRGRPRKVKGIFSPPASARLGLIGRTNPIWRQLGRSRVGPFPPLANAGERYQRRSCSPLILEGEL